ncbi:MAG: 3-dehydroquinate synthase [Clostridia bacterium]|nr:3-dehydroquinate synthase [Clostridia bacterium]
MNNSENHIEETVRVDASRSYDILIGRGLLTDIGTLSASVVHPCSAVLVTDDTVDALYGDTAEASLTAAGFTVSRFVFPHGEESKNTDTYVRLLNFCAETGITRSDCLFALGGGVVGDLTGFAAATFLRGVRFIQIPTTLLAMVDSSVGGKTGVDLPAGKNLVGAFWQPSLVICDYSLLDTLTPEIFADGCAEVIKYAVINDRPLFERLKKQIRPQLGSVIASCVGNKRDIVNADERDVGCRQLLNLGHTLGHAVEASSSFTVSHGSAVAIGMNLVASAAAKRGHLKKEELAALREMLLSYGLPLVCDYSVKELAAVAASDKKRTGGTITLVIPYAIGDARLVKIPVSELDAFIGEALTASREAL